MKKRTHNSIIFCALISAMISTPSITSATTKSAEESASKSDYRTIEWADLIPTDTEPKAVSGPVDHRQTGFSMPAQASAPVVGKLDKEKVKLAGFVVALEGDDKGVTEFLFVPYMGACVHVPPPPSNQIVYVTTKKPLPLNMIYDALWVSGTMKVESVTSELAKSGYKIVADGFEAYEYN